MMSVESLRVLQYGVMAAKPSLMVGIPMAQIFAAAQIP
jgi:hypothetical protein